MSQEDKRRALVAAASTAGSLLALFFVVTMVAIWPQNPLSVIFGVLGTIIIICALRLGIRHTERRQNRN